MKFLKVALRVACVAVVLYASSMYGDATGGMRAAWLLAEVGAFMAMVMSVTTESKSRY